MISKYELIFFDFDGTLADTFDDIIASVQDTLAETNLPALSRTVIRKNIGKGIRHLIRTCTGNLDEDFLLGSLKVFHKHYDRRCLETTSLYPPVIDVLEALKEKKLTILSNKDAYFVNRIVDHFGIRKYFCDIPSTHEPGLIKPSPALIDRLREKYHIRRERCLIIGDMTIDIETGRAAAITTCAIATGLHQVDELLSCEPDFIIHSLSDLLAES